MCWQCHQNIPNEVVREQLLSNLENPKFEVWNSTSLNHLIISLMGYNGYEVSELSYKLFKGYFTWAKENNPNIEISELEENVNGIYKKIQSLKNSGFSEEALKEICLQSRHSS